MILSFHDLRKGNFTFDDVLLEPGYSEVESRSDVDISTKIGQRTLAVPIISANMESVTEIKMVEAMDAAGGLGILHRYRSYEQTEKWLSILEPKNQYPSIGVKTEDLRAAESYLNISGSKAICVDIAHGDCKAMVDTVKSLKNMGYVDIIAGNIVTQDGARRLIAAGANILKVGVGPGSLCSTRVVTGHGLGQLSAIARVTYVAQMANAGVSVIADGGIRYSGDIVKALAAGANAVMVGGLLAGTYESSAHDTGFYRGMASLEAQIEWRGKVSNDAPEGAVVAVESKGPVKNVIKGLAGGIRSGLSYSGATNLTELRNYSIFNKVTSSVLTESHPHALK